MKPSTPEPALVSEIEAAVRLNMSPELLEYFTGQAAKANDPRKLPCVVEDGVRRYDPAALDAFDAYLAEPWPVSGTAKRPHMPEKLRLEITLEAHCGCAICGHGANGEAAHIEPVATTLSHHPKNLIWLCPNHHSEFDLGFRPRDVNLATVKAVKKMIVNRRRRIWQLELSASQNLLQLIAQYEELKSFLSNQAHEEAHGAASHFVRQDFGALQAAAQAVLTPLQGEATAASPSYQKLAKAIAEIAPATAGDTREAAEEAVRARDAYLLETGQVSCPLCDGSGAYNGNTCPACDGDGALDRVEARNLDLSEFSLVDCPVCDRSGRHKDEVCPICDGDRTIERRFADRVDARDYQNVLCPLCKGEGRYDDGICLECAGAGTLERRHADQVDLRDYAMVACPICKGEGRRKGDTCDACDGEGRLERHSADRLDRRDYQDIDCRLCEGSGRFEGDDCPACEGEGRMERRFDERMDWSHY